ncbi:MAG: PAS domain S-box protein [Planctomycetes bacterium]|nr:PAS domain S-box protein [Planctomycetota bacterium]
MPDSSQRQRPSQKLGAHAQSILEWALDAVIAIDHRSVILAWNPQAEIVFGWKRDEILGRTLPDTILPPGHRDAHVRGLARFLSGGEGKVLNTRLETTALRKDGTEFPVELTIIPERDRRGWIFTAFIRDIGARKRAEDALRESEGRFRNAFEHAGTGMSLTGLDGRFLQVNSELCAMLGFGREELVGKSFGELTHPEEREASFALARRMIAGEAATGRMEKRYLRRDGTVIWAMLSTSLLRDADGTPRYFISQVQDITPRREAADALRRSEETFRSVFEQATTGLALVELDGRFRSVNPAFRRLLDFPEADLLRKTIRDLTHPEEREESGLLMQRMLDGSRESGALVQRYVRRDGREVWGHVAMTLVRNPDASPGYFVVQVQDITRRRHAEEALRVSEKTYRLLFENNPQPMWVYDARSLAFLAVNDAAVHLYGYSRAEFRAMSIRDVRPPEELPRLVAALKDRSNLFRHRGEWTHRRKDGALMTVEISTHGMRFEGRDAVLVMIRDLTERKRAEETLRRTEAQLQQAAKMEAIGRLAGGIAHDFNNLLTIIQGYSQLLGKRLSRGEPAGSELEEIRYAATRGHSLTQQLLTFSRRQVLRPKVLDLNATVEAMDQLLRRVIGENIELVVTRDPTAGRVKADPGQLDQVIMNLALNARDAMPEGGRLTIETSSNGPEAPPGGPWAMLAVADTGSGMDQATLSHIFEPFFTTKEPGRGTGLGLATVYGIVQQNGGHIRVASEPGKGSTFRIFMPQAAGEATDAATAPASARPRRGTETILVVEDEPRVRALAASILRENGYTVIEAAGGAEALRLVDADARPIHLVISDIVMPRMSGTELAGQLAPKRPAARFLFISGYADMSYVHPGGLPEGAAFLAKPFTEEALARRVREVLEGKAGGEGEGA